MPAISFRARCCAVQLGEDGELARAGGRLEHLVGGRHARGERRDETQLDGRGELLELLALLGPPRVRGRERGELPEHGEQPGIRARAGAHGREVAAQEEQQGGLARLIGVLPHPGACAVGGAESVRHRLAQRARIECFAAFQRSQQGGGGPQQSRRGAGVGRIGDRSGLGGGVGGEAHGLSVRLEGRGGSPDGPLSSAARPDAFLPLASSSPRRPRAAGRRGRQPLT